MTQGGQGGDAPPLPPTMTNRTIKTGRNRQQSDFLEISYADYRPETTINGTKQQKILRLWRDSIVYPTL